MFFTLDIEDNLLVAYYMTPFFGKYSSNGELEMITTFDMSGKKILVDKRETENKYKIEQNESNPAAIGISVDRQGRIYLVTTTRPKRKSEQYFVVSNNSTMQVVKKDKSLSEATDRFRLLVFDPTGKIIASKKLTVHCNKFYVYSNNLFIIDSFVGMKIYQYEMPFLEEKRVLKK